MESMTKRTRSSLVAATATTATAALVVVVTTIAMQGRDQQSTKDVVVGGGKRQYRSRPAIPDDNQAQKIRGWNRRLLEELLENSSSSVSTTRNGHSRRNSRRKQRRLDNGDELMALDHHSSKTWDGDVVSSQSLPGPPPNQPLNNDADQSSSVGNASNGGGGGGGGEEFHYYYYPMYTSTLTLGTCTNNGNEPDRYHDSTSPENFLFNTLEECCQAWYVDVVGCTVGNAFPSGEPEQLLVRDTMSGELLSSSGSISTTTSTASASSTTVPESSEEDMTFQSAAAAVAAAAAAAGGGNGDTNVDTGSNHHQYYPSFDAIQYPDGACLNDGKAPVEFMDNPTDFFYESDRECCEEWFLDVDACLDGATTAATAANGGTESTAHNKEEEEGTSLSPTWSDDEVVDETGSLWPTWADDDIKMKEDAMINIGDKSGTLWPTWSTADVVDDTVQDNEHNVDEEGGDMSSVAAEISLSAPDVPDDTTTIQSFMNSPSNEHALYDSFETGDFTKYDWGIPTHHPSVDDIALGSYSDSDSRNIDAWEVDRTSMAYDGNYSARAGMLRSPGSQSNLTITLEGLDVSRGGLLTFAIRAMVEMPVDALYLTIDDQVVRNYDKVTVGDSDDGNGWEEEALMLFPGQHVVTWSYQYFGFPKEGDPEFKTYKMDPRRIGNSWVDAVALEPLTGDVVWPDSGEGAQMILQNSRGGNEVANWSLVTDAHAFLGEHSFIAYTKDITSSSRNYAEISWTVVAGPAGGVLSFAAFGSIFAPLDILEFRVDGVPQVALTVPTSDWEEHYMNIEPGKHTLKWRLLKNAPGLSDEIIDNLDFPEGYQGYAKIDGIKYVENQVYMTSTTSTSTSSTTTDVPASTTTAFAEVASTTEITSTTTEANPTTTSTTVATDELSVSTSEAPMQEAKAEVTTSTTSTTAFHTDPASTTSSSTEPVQEQGSAAPGCAEGLKPVDGLPNCCLEEPNYLGDGACDPSGPYNTEECAFDLGDCCYETCNKDSPYGCLTVEGNADEVGPFGFFCLDPRYSIIDEEKCKVENRGWIGDGGCDAEGGYNTKECKYFFCFVSILRITG